jgi:hypothetical protein
VYPRVNQLDDVRVLQTLQDFNLCPKARNSTFVLQPLECELSPKFFLCIKDAVDPTLATLLQGAENLPSPAVQFFLGQSILQAGALNPKTPMPDR